MTDGAKQVSICAIAAMDEARVIGFKNSLPWKIPEDMRRFSALTRGHTVLMGRKTYESLPEKFKPLPGRKNVVATRGKLDAPQEVQTVSSAEDFVRSCKDGSAAVPSGKLWIIGGEKIYKATFPFWDEMYLTLVNGKHEGDAFLPVFEDDFEVSGKQDFAGYSFLSYKRRL